MSVELRAFLALSLGAVGIGFAPICVRMLDLAPVASAFWRLLLATPVLFFMAQAQKSAKAVRPLAETSGPGLRPTSLKAWHPWLPVFAGLAFAADLGVWHYSIHYTTVANATLLANLAPVFIALWTLLVLRHRLGPRYWLGLVLALVGAAVLVGASFGLRGPALFGDGLGVLTAMFYAAYQLSVTAARKRMNTWDLMWQSTAVAAAALFPFALWAGHWWPNSPQDWAWLIALAGISHIMGQGLIAYAFAHLSSAFSSVSLLIQPIAAAGFAWLLLAEVVSPQQAVGGGVVLVGIVLCRGRPAKTGA